MDFGEVFARAWEVVWRNKILWLFGVFASCGGQGGGSAGRGVNYQIDSGDFEGLQPGMRAPFEGILPSEISDEAVLAMVIGVICLGLLLVLFLFVLSTFGRVGLIKGTQQLEGGAASLSFGGLYEHSKPYMWRALGLNLLIGLLFFGVAFIILTLFVFLTALTFGIGLLCLIPAICLFIPIAWFMSIVIEGMNVALVVEDVGIGAAIGRGWEVVRDNLGSYAVMGLILIIGEAVVGLVIGIPLFLAVVPLFAGLFGAGSGSGEYLFGGLAVAATCFVVYLPVLLMAQGVLQAYIHSAWTLTFLRLRGDARPEPVEAMPVAA